MCLFLIPDIPNKHVDIPNIHISELVPKWHKKMLQAHAYFIGHFMYVLSDNHVNIG